MTSTAVDERTITLDDFLQLQALLNYEQEERDKHIAQCQNSHQEEQVKPVVLRAHPVHAHRHIQFRRAIDPQAALQSRLEKARLADALMKLKWLKDQYRRQRTLEIQHYLEHYRRQALVCAVLQEEEERYYRQCIAAALEQRRVQLCLQQYLDMKRQQELQSQFETQQFLANQQEQREEEEEEDESEGYAEYHSKQLEAFLKHIFNQQIQEEAEIACKKQAESEEEQALAMAQVWRYLSDQKENNETPRSAFLSSDHDALLGRTTETNQLANNKDDPTTTNTDEFKNEEQQQQEEEDIDKTESPANQFPPVQDHVVSLQDLIHQLASEPVLVNEQTVQYSDEPKPSGIWAKQQTHKAKHHQSTAPPLVVTTKKEEPEEKKKKAFLPQHIFTEAEPTPTLENMPNTPLGIQEDDEEEEERQDFQHFVDSIASEQKNEIVPPDPKKLKTRDELDAISHQLLDPGNDLVKRWQRVMDGGKDGKQKLNFAKQQEGTLLLTASTDYNREFLGSEDELMRVILKLDTIDSLGNDSIREQRKKLVKICESMLDNLDNLKQSQWEKAVLKNK